MRRDAEESGVPNLANGGARSRSGAPITLTHFPNDLVRPTRRMDAPSSWGIECDNSLPRESAKTETFQSSLRSARRESRVCTPGCILFGIRSLTGAEVRDKRVLEVGSRDINGSLRPIIESLAPSEYVGVDAEAGPGVDLVGKVEGIADRFGEDSFDLVISTEMLEHVRDWRIAVSNMKRVCRGNGVIILTTRSIGFQYHGYPYDFWRYEPGDVQAIFSDMEILSLERDRAKEPGVFAKIRKPTEFFECDLSSQALYSIIARERVRDIDDRVLRKFLLRRRFVNRLAKV